MTHSFSTPQGPFKLAYLAQYSGASLHDNKGCDFTITDVAPLHQAQTHHISMLHQKKYMQAFKNSAAGACIVAPEYIPHAPEQMYLLIHPHPYKIYALIAQLFYPQGDFSSYTAPSAYLASTATIGTQCRIEHGAYIGEGVTIGNHCKIGVNSYIGDGVVLGDNCIIENNVSISHAVIGNNALIYPGARIGQDGFGFASDEKGHYKIPHVGGVVIGNDVEIGANTCIDRGSMDNTVIGDGCRLDNLIQIGHNVKIGKYSILCGQVGISGSSNIGDYVVLAGQVGVTNHINVGNHTTVLVRALVTKSIPPNVRVGGFPAVLERDWQRQLYFLKKQSKKKALADSE